MGRSALAALIAAAALTGGVAKAQPGDFDPAPPTRFKCDDGGELRAQFASRNARLVAIVDSGDGQPHALPIVPWKDGPVMLTWTDGVRTLTWSPGVQIMWMDGASHRMCGRGGHSH